LRIKPFEPPDEPPEPAELPIFWEILLQIVLFCAAGMAAFGLVAVLPRKCFNSFPEPVTALCDFEPDWEPLLEAFQSGWEGSKRSSDLIGGSFVDLKILSTPAFVRTQQDAFSEPWPRRHALADARALRLGYKAFQTYQDLQPTRS
jgi:hypothetical protein